jgi:hypothetical protein
MSSHDAHGVPDVLNASEFRAARHTESKRVEVCADGLSVFNRTAMCAVSASTEWFVCLRYLACERNSTFDLKERSHC